MTKDAPRERVGRDPGAIGDIKAMWLSIKTFFGLFRTERSMRVEGIVITSASLVAALRPLWGWPPFGWGSWVVMVVVAAFWLGAEAMNSYREAVMNAAVNDPEVYDPVLGRLKDLSAAPVAPAGIAATVAYFLLMIHPL
jgi:diacylglycerol kinase